MRTADDRFRRKLAAGEVLFRQGDHGDAAYVIESGGIEIFTPAADGKTVLARLGPDEIFGEMALAGDQTRTASAAAISATVLSVLTHERLAERLAQADPLLRHLLRVTLARSRDSLRRINGAARTTEVAPRADLEDSAQDRSAALTRLRMEQEIERALEQGEFQLHYQPITRLANNQVAGFESLIRWIKPDGSKVPPDRFVGVAEESGFIVPLGHWIIRKACAGLRRLESVPRYAGAEAPFVNINLSIRQFRDPDLFQVLQTAMAAEGLHPERIKLEITESMVMGNLEAALALLQRCKAIGCKLAVDDFGTGYSSLSYLHKFPVDVLKLDRSFLRDMAQSERAAKIVRAVAGMASDLGMETVVEGVETAEQAAACHRAGIHYAQGFHYSAALPLEDAARYLQKTASSS